jgi:TctA family transporter
MSDAVSCAEVVGLSVELLPARTVLSLFGLDGDNVVIADACQTTHAAATGGLIGLVGLGSPAQDTVACQPAAIVANNGR